MTISNTKYLSNFINFHYTPKSNFLGSYQERKRTSDKGIESNKRHNQ